MVDMPLGIYRLDSMLDGGVPTGSVIVLATEPGAGGRQFARTSAAMNALATADNELYERYYLRDLDADTVVAPQTVNYVSLSATAESLASTLAETVADDAAASAADAISYRDFSPTYFESSPVPPAWYRTDDATPSSLPPHDTAADPADDDGPSPLPADTESDGATGADTEADIGVEQVAEFDGVRPPEYDEGDDTATDSDADQPSAADAGGDPFEYGDTNGPEDDTPAEQAGLPGEDTESVAADDVAGATDTDAADEADENDAGGYDPTTDGGTPRERAERDPSEDADAASPPILPALQSYLTDNAPGTLTVIDAITDLRPLPDDEAAWPEVTRLLRGLTRAVSSWGGVVLVVADAEAVTDAELGGLSAAATGTLEFNWATGGSQRARVMNIRELRGALTRLDRDEIAQFEAEMHDRGYDLSNVRKIR